MASETIVGDLPWQVLQRAKKNLEAGEDQDGSAIVDIWSCSWQYHAQNEARQLIEDRCVLCATVFTCAISYAIHFGRWLLQLQDLWLKQLDTLTALQLPVIEQELPPL